MAKILVADDSDMALSELKKVLEDGGHQVHAVENGKLAYELLQTEEGLDLIVCDIKMPEMDGLSFVKKKHDEQLCPNVPVVLLTADPGDQESKAYVKEMGVVAWITKPYRPEMLLKGITKVLSR